MRNSGIRFGLDDLKINKAFIGGSRAADAGRGTVELVVRRARQSPRYR